MKRADELGERLRRLFDESKGRRWSLVDGPGEVVVEEKARDGLAEIRLARRSSRRHTLLIASQFSAISCAVHAAPSSLNFPALCTTL